MTLPNKITIARILLIPLFVWLALDYIRDYQKDQEHEWERVLAFTIFAVAAISDGVDGYIARRYHQKSELGTFLERLAEADLHVINYSQLRIVGESLAPGKRDLLLVAEVNGELVGQAAAVGELQ